MVGPTFTVIQALSVDEDGKNEQYLPISPNPGRRCQLQRGQLNFSHQSTECGSVNEKKNNMTEEVIKHLLHANYGVGFIYLT